MLPKKNRVDTKTVEKIFKGGKTLFSTSFAFKYIKTPNKKPRVSVLSPKNIAKSAVKRNLLRRRGYIALEKYINQFPAGIAGVVLFKKYQDNISIIQNEIKTVLTKIS